MKILKTKGFNFYIYIYSSIGHDKIIITYTHKWTQKTPRKHLKINDFALPGSLNTGKKLHTLLNQN